MKRKLYPRITEALTFVGFKLPVSLKDDVDAICRAQMQTRSEMMRQLILEALRARGRVATPSEIAAMAESAA